MTEGEIVAHLAASGRYRILQKLEPRETAGLRRRGFPLKGVVLDTETTGLKNRNEDIIEIVLIAFTFDERKGIGDVIGVYSGLQQPGKPLPAEITRLTGITDEMVLGQMLTCIPCTHLLLQPI
jgi:DNA polymerase III subunit epsilon